MDSNNEYVIELGEGFSDDDVTIAAGHETIWHDQHVSTDYSIGVAKIIMVSVPITSAFITFHVEQTNRVRNATVTIAEITSNRIRCAFDSDGNMIIKPVRDETIF